MQYFGGKAKIAKYIVPYLEGVRKENQIFIEPFVGGANIVSQMSGKRKAYDFNEYLIEMYKGVQNGYELPDSLTEEEYKYIREHKDEDKVLTGFVGFGCSFAGKWFGGYARNKQNHNYCKASKNSLMKKMSTMADVEFDWRDYKSLFLLVNYPLYLNNFSTLLHTLSDLSLIFVLVGISKTLTKSSGASYSDM